MSKENILEYKGYYTKIVYDSELNVLVGKLEGINDLVCFESEDASKIVDEFHLAVDDYLIMCEDNGFIPNKTYKGTFNVRIKSDLHKKISQYAFKEDKSLNSVVEEAIAEYVIKKDNE